MTNNRYAERKAIYEQKKCEIARTAKTPQEYERRIQALAKKLNL